MEKIIIGSRGSDLALWQANHVMAQLNSLGCEVEIKVISTKGDRIQDLSFDKLEGKGFFTKEIEEALLNNSIDLAVHSHKDLETSQPDGLTIAAVSDREDPADILLVKKESVDSSKYLEVKSNAVIGTSSARRKALLSAFRDDVAIQDLRGNVPTRIEKLRTGNYDAIVLANAGVSRLELDLSDFHVVRLEPKEFVPAPAQGVLGLQVRKDDKRVFDIVNQLNNSEVENRISVERKILKLLDGGCQLPLGAYCEFKNKKFEVWAAKGENDGTVQRVQLSFDSNEGAAEEIVSQLKKKALN